MGVTVIGVVIFAMFWLLAIACLMTPTKRFTSAWDRVTRARGREDKTQLQIMLDHLRSYPEDWSITREGASFPKDGAKQIYLSYDKGELQYSLSSFGTSSRPLDGHFGKLFNEALVAENGRRESQALLRNFYPDLNGPLLLGKK